MEIPDCYMHTDEFQWFLDRLEAMIDEDDRNNFEGRGKIIDRIEAVINDARDGTMNNYRNEHYLQGGFK